jgi:transposase
MAWTEITRRQHDRRSLRDAKDSFPTLLCLFADGAYAGDKLDVEMIRTDGPAIEIVRRKGEARGFVVIARRWVVEPALAWIGRCRRLAKGWETSIASSEAWTLIASIRRLSRRVARHAEEAPVF